MAWLLPTLGSAIAFGVWGIFGKLALRSLSWGDVLVATAVVYALTAAVLAATGRAGIHLGGDFGWALATGVCGAVALVCFYVAVGSGYDVGTIVAISGSYPAITVVLAAVFLGDALTMSKVVGVVLVLGGLVLLSING
jgi:transporter family protein